MGTWIAVGFIAGAALVLVLAMLFIGGSVPKRVPEPPRWGLPVPDEVRSVRFPLAFQGYDPEHVDAALTAIVAAYEELYFAAGPAAIARARERLGDRGGPTGPGRVPDGPGSIEVPGRGAT